MSDLLEELEREWERKDRARMIGTWREWCPVKGRRCTQREWLTKDYDVMECMGCGQTMTLDECPF